LNGNAGALRSLTHPPGHHFFGYYGITPWNRGGTLHLALETDFHEHPPSVRDRATVVMVPHDGGAPIPIGTTGAFNLQQGAMLNWITGSRGEEVSYNVRASDPPPAGNPEERPAETGRARVSGGSAERGLRTAVYNPASDTHRYLDYALSAVAPQTASGAARAGLGAGLSFLRMGRLRPVVGYAGESGGSARSSAPASPDPQPTDDGLFLLDLESGEGRLALSIAELAAQAGAQQGEFAQRSPSGIAEAPPPDQALWFNHTVFSPSGRSLVFLARAKTAEKWSTSLWLYDIPEVTLDCLIPFGHWVSHFLWLDECTVLVSSDVLATPGFVEIEIPQAAGSAPLMRPTRIPGLPTDGHPVLSPDGSYLVCDTYHHHEPDGAARLLRIPRTGGRRSGPDSEEPTAPEVIARLPAPAWCRGDIRCDLHPRVSPDGGAVSIDSVHEGGRQIYVWDVPSPSER